MTGAAAESGVVGIRGSGTRRTDRADRAVTWWAFVARLGIALAVLIPLGVLDALAVGGTRRPSLAAVVALTVVLAALVWSVSGPIERWAYHRVHGAEADTYLTMHQLLTRMSTTLDIDEVVGRLAETVVQTTRSTRAEVSVALDGGQAWTRVWPERADPEATNHVSRQIRHLGEHVGDLRLDGASGATADRALDGIAAPAGLALSTVRLTHALRRRRDQLDRRTVELRRSRERLLEVDAEQRRRLRAEIDARVRSHLRAAAAAADPERAADELSTALDALRRLARGVFPPRLPDDGVLVSLQDWSAERGLTLEADGSDEMLRADPEAARCFYFCAVAAVDAAPEGAPAALSIELTEDAAALVLRVVSDDSPRGTPMQIGGDRAAAFDGTFVAGSVDGTLTITCRIPLVSENEPAETPENGRR